MATIELRLKESRSLLRAAKEAYMSKNLDLLYLIEEKLINIWISDFKEYHGKTLCEIVDRPDVTEFSGNIEHVQFLTANLEELKRVTNALGLDVGF